jgi:GMP synthase (glutamine-hydrolysing)
LKIIELIHDYDHPDVPSNVDIWVEKSGWSTRRHYAYKEPRFPVPADFDLVIVHGGSQHLWFKEDHPWLSNEIEFVRKAITQGIPVVGFCLGSQIIAEAFGGKVFQSAENETGFYDVSPYPAASEHLILRGLDTGFSVFEWHSDHYTLPEGFTALAYSEKAANQIIANPQIPAVGFQFHPEYTKKIIIEYTAANPNEVWKINNAPLQIGEFARAVAQMKDTYSLFEKLMLNTLDYLNTTFAHLHL